VAKLKSKAFDVMSAGHQNGRMDDRDVNKNGNGNKGCGKTGLHLEQMLKNFFYVTISQMNFMYPLLPLSYKNASWPCG